MRGYMDYHSDRFADCSMMAFKGNRLMALLPANITGDGVLHSHQGLTYGGWILPPAHFDCVAMMEMWTVWLDHCRLSGIKEIDYKTLPYIYAVMPSQEDEYMLFRCDARLVSTNISCAVPLAANPGFNSLQRRHLRKALSEDVVFRETDDVDGFMALAGQCLAERHDTRPVHTAAEMRLLKDRFPDNIRIFGIFSGDLIQAGVMVYDTPVTAHCQYIATTPFARDHNLLTPLFSRLINDMFSHKTYFDFGISNEDGGRMLNGGLYRQKASYGGSGVACNRYSISL